MIFLLYKIFKFTNWYWYKIINKVIIFNQIFPDNSLTIA